MTAPPKVVLTENPYPGLRPFEEEDSFLFFGRQRQIRELLARLDDRRFLAVVGLSGSGKSSLVRAGLLPALRRGGLSDSGVRWRIALLRPGSDPIGALAAALHRPGVLGASGDRGALLRGSSAGLIHAGRSGRKPAHNLLVVVDQFEELFRSRKEKTHRWSEAIDFVDLLLTAAREHTPEYRIYVVITIRSDYLGDCAQFRDLSEELNRSQYLVSRLSDDQWYEAIEGPARLTGTRNEPQLLQRLMADAGDQPDQLPILQHLLSRMWDKRADPHLITVDSYRSVGGWQHALDQHVSELISGIHSRELETTRIVFQRLTEIGDARRDSRRPTLLRELNELTGTDTAPLIDRFRAEGYNFLSSPDFDLTASSIIDISHESLIRCWQLLNNWARQEAESAQAYRRLEDRAEQHSRGNADPLSEREIPVANEQRQVNRWSLAWALRYASGTDAEEKRASFERTIAYLDRSAAHAFRRARRRRIVFWSAIAASVVFACLALAAMLLWQQARRDREAAQVAVARAQVAEASARSAQTAAEDEKGHATVAQADAFSRFLASEAERHSANDFDSTFTTLLAAESLRREMTDQGYRTWLRSPAMRLDSLRVFKQPRSIDVLEFAPEGDLFVREGEEPRSWRNVSPGRPVTPAHAQTIPGMSLAFSRDGSLLATGADFFGAVSIYDRRDGSRRCTTKRSTLVTAIGFDASARRLFASSSVGVAVLDTGSCAVLHSTEKGKAAQWIGLDPEGKTVAVAAGSLLMLNADDLSEWANRPRVPQGRFQGSAFHLPSWRMAIAPGGFAIQVWDFLGKALVAQWLARNVHSLALSPDGLTVAASTNEGLRLFDLRTNQETNRLRMESAGFVAFSPEGRQLAVIVKKDVHLFAVPPISAPSAPAVASGSTSPDGKLRAASGHAHQDCVIHGPDYDTTFDDGMVVLDVIHRIQAEQAPDLAVRWNCKAGKCGSCSAEINGMPKLMCMTRMSELDLNMPVIVEPMHAFPSIRDLVTDVSWNFRVKKTIKKFNPCPPPAPDGTWRIQQADVDRVQEFRKCIECFLCQDVCHVLREHHKHEQFIGPRFLVHAAALQMHPLDTEDRIPELRKNHGIGYCNITTCCRQVCPEFITITENAIIPLKERVVDQYFDPLKKIFHIL